MPDNGVIAALNLRFERMAEVLRMGEFAQLPELVCELEGLTNRLVRQGAELTGPELTALRVRADRALRRFAAARDGVQAAAQRIAQLRQISSELSTYDRDGRGQTLRFAAQTMEHRA